MLKITIEKIVDKPERYENNTGYGTSEAGATVEWVDSTEECSIPMIVFGWRQEHSFYGVSESEAAALSAAGFVVENGECRVIEKRTRHITLMNFRRYGWSWAPGDRADIGYAGGHTYANGAAFGRTVIPELVIRDSLIATWCEMIGSGIQDGTALPKFFDCGEVHELLDAALVDAVQNMTRHAKQKGRGTGYFKGRVVGGRQIDDCSENVAALN